MFTSTNAKHARKALGPIVCNPTGKVIDRSWWQSRKAQESMSARVLGKTTEVSRPHPSKHSSPMEINPSGKMTATNHVHPANTLPMDSIPTGKTRMVHVLMGAISKRRPSMWTERSARRGANCMVRCDGLTKICCRLFAKTKNNKVQVFKSSSI